MTKLRPVDIYNSLMNMESSSYPHGSWMTHEDIQIDALRAAMETCSYVDDYGDRVIYVEDLQDLIQDLIEQSNELKLNRKVVKETQVKETIEEKVDWVNLFHSGAFELDYSLVPSVEDLKEELRLMKEYENRCFDV